MIVNMLGKFIEVDLVHGWVMCISTFLKLVEIAIDKPLKSDFMNGKQNGKLVWVNLKYDKLSDLCYNYGIIGHQAKECNHRAMEDSSLIGKGLFGPHVKANPLPKTKTIILANQDNFKQSFSSPSLAQLTNTATQSNAKKFSSQQIPSRQPISSFVSSINNFTPTKPSRSNPANPIVMIRRSDRYRR